MININKIASSSKGNCFVISDKKQSVMIECGLPYKRIVKALGKTLFDIDACLITHEHQDHAKSWQELSFYGKKCFMTAGTLDALKKTTKKSVGNVEIIKDGRQFNLGEWICLPFTTQHQAQEPVGFLIKTNTAKILFATDTYYIKYRFAGLTHIIIECNYDEELLNQNVADGTIEKEFRLKVLRNHFSFSNMKKFIEATDLSKTREIHLIHPSDLNVDIIKVSDEVRKMTSLPVYI